MLHPAVAHDLIEREACVAREAHGQRIASLDVVGTDVICAFLIEALGTVLFRFDGARYDAEPFGFAVIDTGYHELRNAGFDVRQQRHSNMSRPVPCRPNPFRERDSSLDAAPETNRQRKADFLGSSISDCSVANPFDLVPDIANEAG